MKSLSELNSFANQSLELTDGRPARVIFDRSQPLAQIIDLDDGNLTETVPNGTEIIEIINYSTANVRYRVSVKSAIGTPLTASTVTWASLPTGVTVTESPADTWTVTGITSVADWDAVKTPTWTLPSDFASAYNWFYLESSIIYYDEDLGRDVTVTYDVYDINYYPDLQLFSNFDITPNAAKTVRTTVALSAAGFILELGTRLRLADAALTSTATVFCETAPIKEPELPVFSAAFTQSSITPKKFAGFTRNYPVTASITTVAGYLRFFASQMTAVAGPIGPGGNAYLEGNGFALGTGLGFWPQGFPGVTRIREMPAALTVSSNLSCIGEDARLMSAMVMSSGTLTVDVIQYIGTVQDFTTAFTFTGTARVDASAFADITALSDVDALIGVIKQFNSEITATANLSLVITGDNPALPTLDFEPTEVTVSQTLVNTSNLLGQQNQLALLGKRSDGWHRLWMYPTGNGTVKYAHNDTQAASTYQLSTDTRSANQLYSTSDAYFNTDGSYSGVAFHYSSGTYVIAHLTYVDSWSSSPIQTSTPQRAASNNRSDEYVKSGATNRIVGTALTPLYDTNTQRGLGFFTNGTSTFSIKCTKHIWNNTEFTHNSSSSFTVTSLYSPTLPWNSTGFTSDDSTVRFLVLRYTSLTAIDLLIGTTVINDENAPSVTSTGTVFSVNNNAIATNDLATVWDDFDNDKFVALAMAVDDTGVDLRAVKITDWSTSAYTLGAAKTVSGYGAGIYLPSAKLTRIKGTQGMAVLTYQRTSGDDAVLGRLISVNSSTLQVDIGAETYFGSSNDVTSVRMDSYLVDFAKLGTEYAFALAWKEINSTPNTRGGTTFSTATG